jgi:hypothetical protein
MPEEVGSLAVGTRFYLSTYHLQAASHLQEQSGRAEQIFRGSPTAEAGMTPEERGQALFEHSSYVLGTVLSSVAFLEALINELFIDAVHDHGAGPAQQIPTEVKERLKEAWQRSIETLSILTKYQAALLLAGKPSFDPGVRPYQPVKILVQLRNRLTHFVPETRWADEGPSTFEGRLLAQRFALHPRYERSPGNPVFPDKCLSHGCAQWAFSSAQSYADDFCARMEIEPNYHSMRPSRVDA